MRASAATAIVHCCKVSSWTPCDHDSTFESWFLGEHHSAESCFMLLSLPFYVSYLSPLPSALNAL
jgi:hypothetical protein